MDDFVRLPDEYTVLKENEDRSSQNVITHRVKDNVKERNKLRKATQLICASATTVVIATSAMSSGILNRFSLFLDGVHDAEKSTVQLTDIRPDNEGGLIGTNSFSADEKVVIEFEYFVGNEENQSADRLEEGILFSFSNNPIDLTNNPDHVDRHQPKEQRYDGLFGLDIAISEDTHSLKDHVAVIGDSYDNVLGLIEVDSLENVVHQVKMVYDDHFLEVEHDNEVLKIDQLDDLGSQALYINITSSTGTNFSTALLHDLRINGEPIVIENPEHNRESSICIRLDWSDGFVVPHDLEEGEIEVVCAKCHNEGKVTCSTCSGNGSVVGTVCRACEGRGWIGCDRCGRMGDTTVNIEETIEDFIPLTEQICPDCQGHGFICPGDPRADDPEGCHGEMYVHCKACNNTGYQNGKLCSWCKGTLTHLCPSFESHYTCEKCQGSGVIRQ